MISENQIQYKKKVEMLHSVSTKLLTITLIQIL